MSIPALPKYLDIARAIEAHVVGRGGAKVPSSRQVAQTYGVSVVTASRAIQVLRDKGMIRTLDRSGSFVAPAAERSECFALVLRSTPGPGYHASLAFAQAGFAALARQQGIKIEHDRFHFGEPARPAELRRQARRAAEDGISGVILMPSRLSDGMASEDEAFFAPARRRGSQSSSSSATSADAAVRSSSIWSQPTIWTAACDALST